VEIKKGGEKGRERNEGRREWKEGKGRVSTHKCFQKWVPYCLCLELIKIWRFPYRPAVTVKRVTSFPAACREQIIDNSAGK